MVQWISRLRESAIIYAMLQLKTEQNEVEQLSVYVREINDLEESIQPIVNSIDDLNLADVETELTGQEKIKNFDYDNFGSKLSKLGTKIISQSKLLTKKDEKEMA